MYEALRTFVVVPKETTKLEIFNQRFCDSIWGTEGYTYGSAGGGGVVYMPIEQMVLRWKDARNRSLRSGDLIHIYTKPL